MRGITHLGAGVLVAVMMPNAGIGDFVGLIMGSVLPDIDSKTSIIGRYVPVLPKMIPHRTITHSLLMVAGAVLLSKSLGLGILLHIVLDMFTKEGVPLFWPIKKKFRIPIIAKKTKSGGWLDGCLGGVIWMANIWLCWNLTLGADVNSWPWLHWFCQTTV